ncbi:hypothetical protein [Streptomyces sp. NPDC058394]|uniref:hypothetical protein n=1 Tax=unclassified Streptomyces TaxID=2593676 RepID=UPI003656FD10
MPSPPGHADASFAGYVIWLGLVDEAVIAGRHRWPRGVDKRLFASGPEDAEAIADAGASGVPELEMERALERYDRMRPFRVRCSVESGQQFSRSFAGRSGRPNKDLAELWCVDDCCRTARQARVSGCDQSAGLPFAAGTDPVHYFA